MLDQEKEEAWRKQLPDWFKEAVARDPACEAALIKWLPRPRSPASQAWFDEDEANAKRIRDIEKFDRWWNQQPANANKQIHSFTSRYGVNSGSVPAKKGLDVTETLVMQKLAVAARPNDKEKKQATTGAREQNNRSSLPELSPASTSTPSPRSIGRDSPLRPPIPRRDADDWKRRQAKCNWLSMMCRRKL